MFGNASPEELRLFNLNLQNTSQNRLSHAGIVLNVDSLGLWFSSVISVCLVLLCFGVLSNLFFVLLLLNIKYK